MGTIYFLILIVALLVLWTVDRVVRRLLEHRRRRRWLEAQAENVGLRRMRGETDEELRERMRRVIAGPLRTRELLELALRDALWRRGYPRARVEVLPPSEQGGWRVRAVVRSPKVPAADLQAAATEVEDHVPLGFVLDVES